MHTNKTDHVDITTIADNHKIATTKCTIFQRAVLGPAASTLTHGITTHESSGAGKTFVAEFLALVAISAGLRVMTIILMGVRAMALGDI